MSAFTDKLNNQLANEFAASQQYIAIAVWYDDETLPLLARHFYRQAVEERRRRRTQARGRGGRVPPRQVDQLNGVCGRWSRSPSTVRSTRSL